MPLDAVVQVGRATPMSLRTQEKRLSWWDMPRMARDHGSPPDHMVLAPHVASLAIALFPVGLQLCNSCGKTGHIARCDQNKSDKTSKSPPTKKMKAYRAKIESEEDTVKV